MFPKAGKMHKEKAPLTRELQIGLITLSLTALCLEFYSSGSHCNYLCFFHKIYELGE